MYIDRVLGTGVIIYGGLLSRSTYEIMLLTKSWSSDAIFFNIIIGWGFVVAIFAAGILLWLRPRYPRFTGACGAIILVQVIPTLDTLLGITMTTESILFILFYVVTIIAGHRLWFRSSKLVELEGVTSAS